MAKLKKGKTERGFAIVKFKDIGDNECTLQKSSIATEDCIWLGCNDIGLKKFTPIPGPGWEDVPTVDEGPGGINYLANNRMHLTREQVANLLPYLERFVKMGEL